MSYFDEVYDRIKFATNARTQVELAEMLEIRQSSISDAKRRRSIPAEWYIKLYDKFGLSLDWLRWRSGPMYSKDKASVVPDVPDDATFSSGLRSKTRSSTISTRPFANVSRFKKPGNCRRRKISFAASRSGLMMSERPNSPRII